MSENPPVGQPPENENPYGQQKPPVPPSQGGYPPAGGYPPPGGGYPPPGGFPSAPPPQEPWGAPASYGGPVRVGQAVGYGWDKFKSNAGVWILAVIVIGVISGIVSGIFSPQVRALQDVDWSDPESIEVPALTFGSALLGAIGAVISFVVQSLASHGALAQTRKARVSLGDFFAVRNLGGIVLLGVVIGLINLVLAFVPFFGALAILVINFFLTFALMFVIDKGENALTAIGSSFRLVADSPGVVILTILAVIGLTILGFVLCFVGLLVTFPIASIAVAFVYRRLIGEQPV
ncbi:putative membrane protein [Sediminihabitans luteus]|uniref:Putative membrane protein n=1 Tax=Sediminihabitans luteus TaxID=1138585 RepID=A0A2M9CPU9_9CELL|nr:hypothetical protein [Sediminihabitans luteus]PJJ73923.1 putative membrane protein [Sediminihabitans luteus]GII98164.1 hypothetical protein Slu03_05420 [Sediminihabitans luteus]